jgi:hypothetical protein
MHIALAHLCSRDEAGRRLRGMPLLSPRRLRLLGLLALPTHDALALASTLGQLWSRYSVNIKPKLKRAIAGRGL